MTFKKKIFFISTVLIQAGVLLFMVIDRLLLLQNGKTVLLKCRPIDPRSLFSGDYVILTYQISNLDKNKILYLQEKQNIKKNSSLYVALMKKPGDKFYEAVDAHLDIHELKKKYSTIIRGVVVHTYRFRIRYGVENYFVPQYKGLEIEKNLFNAHVEIALSDSGESAIRKLYIDNKEVKFN